MAVDVDEVDTKTVQIVGKEYQYVLSVVGHEGLEVSVYESSRDDLAELKREIEHSLTAKSPVVLIRTDSSHSASNAWEALSPRLFAARLTEIA